MKYNFDRQRKPLVWMAALLSVLPVLGLLAGLGFGSTFDAGAAEAVQVQMGGIGTAGLFGLGGAAAGQYLREKFEDPKGGGAGVLEEKEFQQKVMGGVEAQQKKLDALVADYDRLDGETKKAFEELTNQKNAYDGMTSSFVKIEQSFKKLSLQLHREQKMAYGDPIQRILADDEKKTLITAMIRKAVKAPMNDDHKKALDSSTTPGSTFINDELMLEVYSTLASYGVYATFAQRQASTKNSKFLVKTARPIAKAFGEGITITEDNNKAGVSVTHTATGIKVLLSVPNELLEDSEIDLSQDILQDFLEAVAYRLDFFCLQADGTNNDIHGGNTGIFEGGVSVVAATGRTTVEQLLQEDYSAAMLAVDEGVLTSQTRWWMHQHQIIRSLATKDANGRSLFLTATEVPTPGGVGSILGSPVTPSFAAPSANGVSSKVATFGDPNGQVVGMRKVFEFKSSQDAGFQDDETVFRGVTRASNKIRKAGAFGVLTTAAS